MKIGSSCDWHLLLQQAKLRPNSEFLQGLVRGTQETDDLIPSNLVTINTSLKKCDNFQKHYSNESRFPTNNTNC